jgi:hypothetical protein
VHERPVLGEPLLIGANTLSPGTILGLGERDGQQRAMMVAQRQKRCLQLQNVSREPPADLVCGRHWRERGDGGPVEASYRSVTPTITAVAVLVSNPAGAQGK